MDLLIEEINQLWSFVQRYVDETAIDMIHVVKSGDRTARDKMDRMDWLARNRNRNRNRNQVMCMDWMTRRRGGLVRMFKVMDRNHNRNRTRTRTVPAMVTVTVTETAPATVR